MKPFRILFLTLACTALFTSVCAQDKPASSGSSGGGNPAEAGALRLANRNLITTDLKKSVEKGLKALAKLQADDGSFTKGGHQNVAIAVTSMAGMAFVANGCTPDKGLYKKNVRNVMNYLLKKQDKNSGYFTSNSDGSRIHGHCYATQFLCQIVGTLKGKIKVERVKNGKKVFVEIEENKILEDAISKAAGLIEDGQTERGGWGYIPDDTTWDEGSTTVCAIQALRAASDAGINIKIKTIQRAIKYMYDISVSKPFTHDGVEYRGYTFKYSYDSSPYGDSYALCAAAVTTLHSTGVYAEGAVWDEADIGRVYKGGLDWLRYKFDDFITRRNKGQGSLDVSHFYYAHFYAAQAMWMAPKDVFFDEYYPKIRDLLIEEQKRNPSNTGAWGAQSYGEAFTTAYALMILQVPYQLLPMYAK